MTLKIATAQLNATLGDLPGNARQIIQAARTAHARGTHLLVAPELAVSGSPALDLLLQPAFVVACEAAVRHIAVETADLDGLTLILGHPAHQPGQARACSAFSLVRQGQGVAIGSRQHINPDEARQLVAGPQPGIVDVAGVACAVLPGRDADDAALVDGAVAAGARLLLVPDAAPFYSGGARALQDGLAATARRARRPLLHVNALGAQDGVVFDGSALALDADGALVGSAAPWLGEPLTCTLDSALRWQPVSAPVDPARDVDADLWQALVLGLRDYLRKSGFTQAALGLSGGLDSALVLALAVDALGPDNVRTLAMPGPFSAGISATDAHEMAQRVGVRCDDIAIGPLFESFNTSLAPLFAGRPEDTTEENLQARIRGTLLMALSNKFGHVILATGNKSEVAVGYSTLYGDTCGGYAPIKDVYKTDVFRLARWRNAHDPFDRGLEPIPERIITRPPSAELRADQVDADSLPPYDVLDAILAGHIEQGQSAAELVAQGHDATTVARVLHLLRTSEYKRVQGAPGTRVSRRSFDGDWHWPLAHKYRAETASPAHAGG